VALRWGRSRPPVAQSAVPLAACRGPGPLGPALLATSRPAQVFSPPLKLRNAASRPWRQGAIGWGNASARSTRSAHRGVGRGWRSTASRPPETVIKEPWLCAAGAGDPADGFGPSGRFAWCHRKPSLCRGPFAGGIGGALAHTPSVAGDALGHGPSPSPVMCSPAENAFVPVTPGGRPGLFLHLDWE